MKTQRKQMEIRFVTQLFRRRLVRRDKHVYTLSDQQKGKRNKSGVRRNKVKWCLNFICLPNLDGLRKKTAK